MMAYVKFKHRLEVISTAIQVRFLNKIILCLNFGLILLILVQQFEERSQIFRAKTANVAQQPSVSVYENTNVCLNLCFFVAKFNFKL